MRFHSSCCCYVSWIYISLLYFVYNMLGCVFVFYKDSLCAVIYYLRTLMQRHLVAIDVLDFVSRRNSVEQDENFSVAIVGFVAAMHFFCVASGAQSRTIAFHTTSPIRTLVDEVALDLCNGYNLNVRNGRIRRGERVSAKDAEKFNCKYKQTSISLHYPVTTMRSN